MGKRTSAPIPTYIPTLGSKLDHSGGWHGNELDVASVDAVSFQVFLPSSHLFSPLPWKHYKTDSLTTQLHREQNRLQLHTSPSIPAYSPTGQLLRRRVKCEETIVAGCGSSVVYWKIVE